MRHDAPLAPAATRTTCPYCGVGCGVLATPDGLGGAAIAGDADHPANRGRLCSKGSALGETLGLGSRVLHPLKRNAAGSYDRIGWGEALDAVANGLRSIAASHGPEAIAFYLSGQLLTEDYYVANKLAKGFIGSPHVDTNSRLCMSSTVAAQRRVFGSDTVPGAYEDFDGADLIVLAGSNTAWCHPVLFRRMQDNRQGRSARLVVLDPRVTATAEDADMVLALRPGSDAALFAGLLVHLAGRGLVDRSYVARHVTGFEETLANACEIAPDIAAVSVATDLPTEQIAAFYELWASTPHVVTAWSQGVNQSAQGTDKVSAILNCHLATGRIGRPGCGPFSLTGQPNAMGGREVGGLANMLAAHMGYAPEEVDRVRRFWQAPNIARREGLKAVQMLDAVAEHRIRAMWVMATNPAASLPDADKARAALAGLDLFIVSENVLSNDTLSAKPHYILPAAAWGEKDGTVTNSERRISRQRAFLPLPGEVKPDWWIVCEVAKRLGFGAAFTYTGAHHIYAEHAALSAFENDGRRDFDIGAHAGLDKAAYDRLRPVQWPVPVQQREGTARLFADGGFFSPERRAQMRPLATPKLASETDSTFPLLLNTGRVRDHWHTMTRTGLSPRLSAHIAEPSVSVNPADIARFGLIEGGFARLASAHGSAVLKVAAGEGVAQGSLFAPIHWSGETASDARIGALAQPLCDPFSGQPEMKATPVSIAPVAYRFEGFVLSREPFALPAESWWARLAVQGGEGRLFATDSAIDALAALMRERFDAHEMTELIDRDGGSYRCAVLREGRLAAALFLAPAGRAPLWDTVKAVFADPAATVESRLTLLSGRSPGGSDPGPTVCACFGVGLNAIRAAFEAGAATAEEIGLQLRAGTNCGSCLPEIRRIGARPRASEAA
ncbi:nitrate reductase [Bosea sp. SSUT16]|jgi:assimilatory nitrate reductase catalytic subunit|uniref:Nitrate reductase n=1 Tax=Bosea spartocytisi TaxID=2773451 RepID=A0A927E596_9HYPH|nr:nitrate reductase [Bosea spartocytisi]MBD3844427.1 nitrate reductase [Bosea spartocytisi]MCT4470467.1 nitrate reductase [Bosea spartocytisi]